MRLARPIVVLAIAVLLSLAACGSDGATNPDVVNALDIVSGDSQATVVGVAAPSPLVVRVRNSAGTGLAGVPVSWSIAGGGGSLSATTDTTDATGEASVVYTPGTKSGAATITSAVSSIAVAFHETLVAASADTLVEVQGDGSAALTGSALPLAVKAEDRYGNGVAGLPVAWSASAGAVSDATSATDSTGVARTTLTLGATAGTYVVTASAGALAPVALTVTAIASAGAGAR